LPDDHTLLGHDLKRHGDSSLGEDGARTPLNKANARDSDRFLVSLDVHLAHLRTDEESLHRQQWVW
jgi:hypothetical protein